MNTESTQHGFGGLQALLALCFFVGQVEAQSKPPRVGFTHPAGETGSDSRAPNALRLPERPLSVRNWTIEDGLPQSTVTSIAQTTDGYLWIGTFGGLVRFDGITFETFSMATTEQFRGNRIVTLEADPSGALWIGMQASGLLRYQAGAFENIETETGENAGFVHDISFDTDLTVWVAAAELFQVRAGVLVPLPGIPADPQWIQFDKSGQLWIAYQFKLVRWDANTPEIFTFEGEQITTLCLSTEGSVLVGFKNGRVVTRTNDAWELEAELDQGFIRDLDFDSENRMRVLTSAGLHVSKFPVSSQTGPEFDSAPGLRGQFRVLFTDREENTFLGTEASGLTQVREMPIPHLPLGSVSHPTLAPNGELWLICRNQVGRLVENEFEPLAGIPYDSVVPACLAADNEGGLWVGARAEGLFHFDGQSVTHTPVAGGIPNISSLTQSRDGVLWIGSKNQVGVLAASGFRREAELDADVIVLVESRSGSIYAGTTKGIHQLEDGRVTQLPLPAGCDEVHVRAIYEDQDGVLWIGTYGLGLIRIQGDDAVQIKSTSGLADDSILALVPDGFGYLWMNSNRGPFRVQLSELNAFASGRTSLVTSDFFSGVEGNGISAGVLGASGLLCFATVTGLSVIDPSAVVTNSVPPGVTINHVFADGVSVSRSKPIIASGHGELDIHYSGLSYTDPSAVRFRFLLEGHQEHWHNAGTSRTASFAKVPPGDYIFRVQACNNSGVWNKTGASFPFTIRPAFYETYWFIGACLVGSLSLALFAHRRKLRTVDEQNRILESRITERTSELASLNDELKALTYTVGHDLRAPLRHINFFAERIQEQLEGSNDQAVDEDMSRIQETSKHMGRLIEDLLNLSKLGRRALHRTPVDTTELVEGLWGEISASEPGREIAFKLGALAPMNVDLKLIKHLWTNLLENARKYTRGNPIAKVEVSSFQRAGRTWYCVADNGVGFDQKHDSALFAPFERLHSDQEFEGTGVGLAIAQRMVQKHGGEILGTGQVGLGATFEFTLDA